MRETTPAGHHPKYDCLFLEQSPGQRWAPQPVADPKLPECRPGDPGTRYVPGPYGDPPTGGRPGDVMTTLRRRALFVKNEEGRPSWPPLNLRCVAAPLLQVLIQDCVAAPLRLCRCFRLQDCEYGPQQRLLRSAPTRRTARHGRLGGPDPKIGPCTPVRSRRPSRECLASLRVRHPDCNVASTATAV